ncbi:MAG TPA: ThuA domain-containing protein [Anaerohalosphaeraceae bacterium]|nr:ThuA domain-containing protein [Anaerohalosphaeraceae bacterium]HPB92656.1 ThuA domain-containing protein [Anaerohalosphaeraceae bacterium]HRT23061.1 ThuA domain-containing protein [Anaerohalosphaeraceae bacterium]HRU14747.1 ThuA domain-containing protein [Anaerohalosphaeraceae bacterium]
MAKRRLLLAGTLSAILALLCLDTAVWAQQDEPMNPSPTPAKLKALILDGQMVFAGHKWQETTPAMKTILESSGRFVVDVFTFPPKGRPNDDFCPAFADYQVIIMNYEGDPWPEKTRRDFVNFIQQGGGLVVVHAADNAFPDWPEWNEMIGLGGWGGRDEKAGPMVWWENGKLVYDDSPGPAGYHGEKADWLVTIRSPNHPITAGLPEKWLHCCDELYSKLRGPAVNLNVLATGWQSPQQRGTGRDELCLFTITYGKGRIFHTTLGHDVASMSCVGFIVTFQRGAEWAACGSVANTGVPEDFPTPDQTRIRKLIPAL